LNAENCATGALLASARGRGNQANLNGNHSSAALSLQRALPLDPNFTMAYATLGTVFSNLGEGNRATGNMKKAYDLRDRGAYCPVRPVPESPIRGKSDRASHDGTAGSMLPVGWKSKRESRIKSSSRRAL